MKKLFLLLFLMGISASSFLKAQSFPKMSYGFKFGTNSSWTTNFPILLNRTAELGYNIGTFTRINLPIKNFYFQPELLFSQNKHSITYINKGIIVYPNIVFLINDNFAENKLDLALLVGKKFNLKNGNFRLDAGIVPTVVFNTETRRNVLATDTLSGYQWTEKDRFKLGSGISPFDSWSVGMGFDFSRITIDLRYQKTFYSPGKASVQFTVGYKIFNR